MLLSSCNVSGNAVAMTATALATEGGAAVLAAHTVLRQVLALCQTSFACFNVAAQSLVATSLGADKPAQARDMLLRTGQLAVCTALPLAGLLYMGQPHLVHLFSHDVAVVDETLAVLPLLIMCMVCEGGVESAACM